MTADSMQPLLRELLDADGDRARAEVLLRMPDNVVLKYASPIADACRRAAFEAGLMFLEMRVAVLCAVRGADGCLPIDIAADAEAMRAALARFVAAPAPTEI